MAEVFLAKAVGPMGFEKTLVVKRILPELAAEPDFVQMFLSEAKLAARLTHPNIVQIFDFGESEGSYFLAMEYIDGPSLRTLIKRAAAQGKPLPPEVCARIISLACEGLAFAHDFTDPETGEAQGLIHRDVSPDNILLSRQGAVKVVDFGIAKATGQSRKTESGVVKGKLPYMPPEQLRAKPLDRRADVYALGVVLYELLTGQRPYASESEAGLMQAILFEPHTPAAEIREDLPFPLRRILNKVLSKDRDQRYADCHAFQADLEKFILSVGTPVTMQQVAHLINRANTDPGESIPVAKEPLKTSSPVPPGLTRKRSSSPPNEAVTANHRGPQVSKQEAQGAPISPPSRRLSSEPQTAPGRPRRPSGPIEIPASNRSLPPQAPTMRRPSMPSWALGLLVFLLTSTGSCDLPQQNADAQPSQATKSSEREVNNQPEQVANNQPAQGGSAQPSVPVSPPPPVDPTPAPPPAPKVRGKGTLVLRVYPYATVFVDGRKMGDTPMQPLQLPAGLHIIKFVHSDRTIEREVDVKAGQDNTLKINMLEG
ncbi:protein kinase domain-containing protein [Archangium lansingense]|uniref:serine/threonine protein kinase n=1 Tax=Archangium lansingense TaxID=2995310 RepID=UPI003B78656D